MARVDLDVIRGWVRRELALRTRWPLFRTTLDFDFSRSEKPLQALQESEVHGGVEEEWKSLFIFCEQDYAKGGGATPFLCVDINTGRIVGLDLERGEEAVFVLNSDIEKFVATFRAFDQVLRIGTLGVDSLKQAAREIDPMAFDVSDWRLLAEAMERRTREK